MRINTKAAAAELLRVVDVGSLAFADWRSGSFGKMLNRPTETH
jgi:hypothetical protein